MSKATDRFLASVRFFTVDEVTAGQLLQLEKYGGGDAGVLNSGPLESAVENARQCVFGMALYNSRFKAAAAYMRGILLNHAYRNGNKRAALGTALEFLHVNGLRIEATDAQLVALVLETVTGHSDDELKFKALVRFFQKHARRMPRPSGTAEQRLDMARAWMHSAYAPTFRKLAE